jgi:outer membrane biosynthesis protein TonB
MLQLLWKNLESPEQGTVFGTWCFFSFVLHITVLFILFCVRTGVVHTVRIGLDDFNNRPVVVVSSLTAAQRKKNQTSAATRMAASGKKMQQSSKGPTTVIKEQKAGAHSGHQKKKEKEKAKLPKAAEKKVEQRAPATPQPLQEKAEEKAVTSQETHKTQSEPDPLYIAQSELEQYEIESIVYNTVTQVWCRPVGLATNVHCKVRVTVDAEGKVIDIQDEEPSGIMMFDSAVYLALEQVQFPARIASKTVSIIFS